MKFLVYIIFIYLLFLPVEITETNNTFYNYFEPPLYDVYFIDTNPCRKYIKETRFYLPIIKRYSLEASEVILSEIICNVLHYSELNNLEPSLVFAIIHTESNFNHKAVGGGAKGLMQIDKVHPVNNIKDIKTNIEYGTGILKNSIDRFGYKKGIIIYNTGIGNYMFGVYKNRGEIYYQVVQRRKRLYE